jgi:uncharacterized RDD family membrane protein YckC
VYPGAAGYPPGYGPGYPGSAYPNVPPAFGYPGASWPGSQVQYGPAPGLAWAGMGHRIGALLLDILFMFGALIVAAMAAEAFGVKRYSQVNTVYSTGATISYLLWVILFLVYQPTCWWAFQGTVGQRLLRLRVVRAADGRSLGAGSTTVRFIIWGLCNVVVVPAIIAAIVAQDEPTQRTWWDDAAGSVVIRQL